MGHYLKGMWLNPSTSKDGYVRVSLMRNGRHVVLVHRLVLETYIGPCPDGMEACHSNGDRSDNRLSNLRWDTSVANEFDKIAHGTYDARISRGEKNGLSKLTELEVRQIDKFHGLGMSRRRLSEMYGVSQNQIRMIALHKQWKHLWGEK